MSRLKKNIIYNLVGQTSLLVIAFISVKYIYKQLGADALGIIYFTIMFNTLLSASLGLGIGPMLIREIANHMKDDEKYVHKLLQTASFIFWGIFLFISILIYFLAPIIVSKWINLESMNMDTAIHIIRVLSITSLLTLPQTIYTALLNGLQRMEYTNTILVVITLLQQFGIITIIILNGSLMNVIHWIAGSHIFMIICYLMVTTRFVSISKFVPKFFFKVFKRNMQFSLNMGVLSILAFLHSQIDKIIISKYLPVGALGYYSIAFSLTSKAAFFAGPVSNAAYPVFCESFKSGTHKQMLIQYKKLQDMICYISIPILSFILFYNQLIFSYLFDINVAKILLIPFVFLCAASFLQVAFQVPYHLLLASGEVGIVRKISSYNLLVSIPISIISIYYLGLSGAGVAFFFSRLINLLFTIPKLSRKCLKLSPIAWYFHIFKVFTLFIMSYTFVWIIILYMNDMQSIYRVTTGYFVASIVYMIGAWFLIGKELKLSLINQRRKLLTKPL